MAKPKTVHKCNIFLLHSLSKNNKFVCSTHKFNNNEATSDLSVVITG